MIPIFSQGWNHWHKIKLQAWWWEIGFPRAEQVYYHFHCQSSRTEVGLQPGNVNNLETGIKLEGWKFSSVSELCGLRYGGKPLPLEIRLETRHASSGHGRVAWFGGSGSLNKVAIDLGSQSSKGLVRARESFKGGSPNSHRQVPAPCWLLARGHSSAPYGWTSLQGYLQLCFPKCKWEGETGTERHRGREGGGESWNAFRDLIAEVTHHSFCYVWFVV